MNKLEMDNLEIDKYNLQAREATYHQFVPGSNDYTTDAPVIPILLSKRSAILISLFIIIIQ